MVDKSGRKIARDHQYLYNMTEEAKIQHEILKEFTTE